MIGVILASVVSAVVVLAMWAGVHGPTVECPVYVQQPTGVEWVCEVSS